MKKNCGLNFAWAAIAFMNACFAQENRQATSIAAKPDWRRYDSIAAASVCAGDTIRALDNYRKCLELNPANEQAKKN